MLLRFVIWLSSNKKLIEGADIHDSDLDSKTLAISSDITTLVASNFTPKHLCLTVYYTFFLEQKTNRRLKYPMFYNVIF